MRGRIGLTRHLHRCHDQRSPVPSLQTRLFRPERESSGNDREVQEVEIPPCARTKWFQVSWQRGGVGPIEFRKRQEHLPSRANMKQIRLTAQGKNRRERNQETQKLPNHAKEGAGEIRTDEIISNSPLDMEDDLSLRSLLNVKYD